MHHNQYTQTVTKRHTTLQRPLRLADLEPAVFAILQSGDLVRSRIASLQMFPEAKDVAASDLPPTDFGLMMRRISPEVRMKGHRPPSAFPMGCERESSGNP